MASLALGVVGAAIGSTLYPGVVALGLTGGSIGWTIGSMLGNYLFPERLPDSQGPRVADLKAQTSAYGVPIPVVYGTVRMGGNVIWSTEIVEEEHVDEVGGKGGPTQEVTTYTYSVSMAVALCEGEITGIRKVWADGQLIYDVGVGADAASVAVSNDKIPSMVIYLGTETQLADPTIEAREGIGNVPGYRGTAYVVLTDFPLQEPYFGRRPNLTFEVVKAGSTTIPSLLHDETVTLNTYSSLSIGGSYSEGVITFIAVDSFDAAKKVFRRRKYDLDGNQLADELRATTAAVNDSSWVAIQNTDNYYLEFDSWIGGYYWSAIDYGTSGVQVQYSGAWGTSTFGASRWARDPSGDGGQFINVTNSSTSPATAGIAVWDYASPAPVRYVNSLVSVSSEPYIIHDGTHVYLYGGGNNWLWRVDPSTLTVINAWDFGSDHKVIVVDGDIVFGHESSGDAIVVYRIFDDDTYATLGSVPLGSAHCQNGIRAIATGAGVAITAATSGFSVWSYTELLDASAVALSTIVGDLCLRAGLLASEYDVTALTETVHGYAVTRPMSARQAIEPMQKYGWFDAVESNGKIKFVLRGAAVAATVTTDDLAARDDASSGADPIVLTRAQEADLPQRVTVNYIEPAADYQAGSVHAQRIITTSRTQALDELAIAMPASKAAQIADVMLYDAWAGRQRYEFATGRKWAHLEPTDVVALSAPGVTHRVRLTKRAEADMLVRWEAVAEDQGVYTPSAAATAGTTSQTISYGGPTALELLDVPLLRVADDGAIGYAAVAKYLPGWRGARVFRSADSGATWDPVATVTTSAVIGAARTVLGAFSGGDVFDELNAVDVDISGTAPSSVTRAQVLGGGNAALLGDEIFQFRTITAVSGSRYTLTGLRRGLLGTEWAMSGHAVGDRFVLLATNSGLAAIGLPVSALNASSDWRAVTLGSSIDRAVTRQAILTGAALKPLSPWQLRGFSRDGNIDFRWVRRSRHAVSGWQGIGSQPLGEASEAYETTIYRDSGYSDAVRILSSAAPAVTYDRGKQVIDFGATQATVYAAVRQLSASVGTGFAAYVTVSGNAAPAVAFGPARVGSTISLSGGNKIASNTGATSQFCRAYLLGIIPAMGKWYAEFSITALTGGGNFASIGISPLSGLGITSTTELGFSADQIASICQYSGSATIVKSGVTSAYGAIWGSGDVIGLLFDADAGTIEFAKGGVRYGPTASGYVPMAAAPFVVGISLYDSGGAGAQSITVRDAASQVYRPAGYASLDA